MDTNELVKSLFAIDSEDRDYSFVVGFNLQ